MYCGWQKGMSRYKATSSSEEISPMALPIVELCFVEGNSLLENLVE